METAEALLRMLDQMAEEFRPVVEDFAALQAKVDEMKETLISDGIHLADAERQAEVVENAADELAKYTTTLCRLVRSTR